MEVENNEEKKEETKEEQDFEKGLYIRGKYKIIQKLGQGSYGKVYQVEDINTGKKYALKVLMKSRNSEADIKNFQNEINILHRLKNKPFIPKIYDNGEFIKDKLKRLYFVVDYAEKGDLFRYLARGQGLGETNAKILFKKIVLGIKSCHEENIGHLDIKISNIILDENFNPLINDFGVSKPIKKSKSNELRLIKGKVGTEYTPQVYEEVPYNGIDADIFALGVLLYRLVFGSYDFISANDASYNYIKEKRYDLFWKERPFVGAVSNKFKNLYLKMVAYDPKERPGIDSILKDPWLDEINILEAKDPEKYKKLEEDYNKCMKEIENDVSLQEQPTDFQVVDDSDNNGINYNNKGIEFNESDEHFKGDIKPNKVKDNRSYKYSIKINGNINPKQMMNLFVNIIIKSYNGKCNVESCQNKLKFIITIETEINFDYNELNTEEEDNNKCMMEIKMLFCKDKEYLLVFNKSQGDLEQFYDNFLKIKDIIKKIFS